MNTIKDLAFKYASLTGKYCGLLKGLMSVARKKGDFYLIEEGEFLKARLLFDKIQKEERK